MPAQSFPTVDSWYRQYLGRPLTTDEYYANWYGREDANESQVANSPEGIAYANRGGDTSTTPPAQPAQSGYINPDGTAGGYLDIPEGGWQIGPNGEVTNLPSGYYWDAHYGAIVKGTPSGGTGGGGGGGGGTPTPSDPTLYFDDPRLRPTPEPGPTTGGTGGGTPPPSGTPPPGTTTPPPVSATDIAAAPPTFGAPPVVKPPAFTFADFTAPTADEVFSDPSYQLRFGMGQKALENSKAAQGVIGTGGSIKDFINYGQNFASQEYGNIFDRKLQTYAANRSNALGTYNTNYQTQYLDPWSEAFQNAQATLQPEMLGYSTQVGAAQHRQDAYDALATHAGDQAALYGFNNKVFDFESALARDQFDWTKSRAATTDAFDQWYRKFLLELQAAS